MFMPFLSIVIALGQAHAADGGEPSSERGVVVRGEYRSVQVNVDSSGANVRGDAANGPSLGVDPANGRNLVVAWRQFNNIRSNSVLVAWAYSTNAGSSWTSGGILEPGVYRDIPHVLSDANGDFLLLSQRYKSSCELHRSTDGGQSWSTAVQVSSKGPCRMITDATTVTPRGHVCFLCGGSLVRSKDGGRSFATSIGLPAEFNDSAMAFAGDGSVYVGAQNPHGVALIRSPSTRPGSRAFSFDGLASFDLGGQLTSNAGPNPGGSLGRLQLAVDPNGPNLYVFASVDPPGPDPLDVMFARSADGGQTWGKAVRINDDTDDSQAWQWFGAMSVAPNGRIDVIWNDTRNGGQANSSELFYTFSTDHGTSWSRNVPVSPAFDSHVGWPSQRKMGDGYALVSDDAGVNVVYTATFNGEQDVYFLRIPRSSPPPLSSDNRGK